MSRVFYKGTHKFINPNRTRVRFYSKIFRRYYTIWITDSGLITKKGAIIIMTESLMKAYNNKKKNELYAEQFINIGDQDWTWEVVIN